MKPECSLCTEPARWTMVRVETAGAVNSFDCHTIDDEWSFSCDEHLYEALCIARNLHGDRPHGVNVHVEEMR